jgi:23S rRNA (cytosine1962-C5)-methyltransferase
MNTLYLKKNEERRIRSGHLWIFSNEVDTKRSPLKGFAMGEQVRVVTASGSFLGNGYVNPNSLICTRIFSRDPVDRLDGALLRRRIEQALRMRESLFSVPYYRLIYSESDFLPGMVVDRYEDVLVVQLTTAGMEAVRSLITDVLFDLLDPRAILWKNDMAAREIEGLPRIVETTGVVPEEGRVVENGAILHFPLHEGQKTGWYFDQSPNRLRFASYTRGRDVLDVFSYVGATATAAIRSGARSVTCVDSSGPALEFARRNIEGQGGPARVELLVQDGFDALKSMKPNRFGAIMLDPPAFIKRKKDLAAGHEAYLRLNTMAVSLISPGGVLSTCSCSQHLSLQDLTDIVRRSGLKAGRTLRILEIGHQGPDHPVHPSMPESAYLKGLICWVE